MNKVNTAVNMLLAEFKKEYGKDKLLEDGEAICGACNDGVVIISFEDEAMGLKVLTGRPYKLDIDLDLIEK